MYHCKRIILFLTLLLLCVASEARAQYIAGEIKTVQADHDGVFTDFYDLLIDSNLVVTLPVANLANNVITFPNITLPARGSHTLVVRARNVDDLFTDSDPLSFTTAKGKPNKPGKPRIVQLLNSLRGSVLAERK